MPIPRTYVKNTDTDYVNVDQSILNNERVTKVIND